MAIYTDIINIFFNKREAEIHNFSRNPIRTQHQQLMMLVDYCANTEIGKACNFSSITSAEEFQRQVPLSDYESFSKYIDRSREGEKAVIWPTPIKWYAKSSGTTEQKSKFIPVSNESLRYNHLQGPKDVLGMFASLYPETKVFNGKTLTLGGSHALDKLSDTAHSGDLSAILIENVPSWAAWKRLPSTETALMPDFEEKIKRICEESIDKNVTAFAGAPSWNMIMLNKILEYTGKKNILEIWPNLELFIHGGMSFDPYRTQYQKLIPSDQMKYMETYNASEGFFAIQDNPASRDMLLMLDYGIFYEFLEVDHLHDPSKTVTLEGVKTGVSYAMIITTNSGLWRYMIGDTVEFTSCSPYKIRITGRTKHFINVFGEEVIVENADRAISKACADAGAEISEYTAGPIFMEDNKKGSHQWVIEFTKEPSDIDRFAQLLDTELQNLNSDYEAKRHNNTTLLAPTVTILPKGSFYRWMQQRGKLGGQNKVPRLSNKREYIDQLLALTK